MLTTVVPMLTFALVSVSGEQIPTPRAAQARLAEAIADADSVDAVAPSDGAVTFTIHRAGESYRLVASLDDQRRIASLAITDVGSVPYAEHGAMTWLVGAMRDVTAIREVVVNPAGVVVLQTSDGRRFAVEPHDGPNAAVEARWAAEWDT
jgi:hypothetical protein